MQNQEGGGTQGPGGGVGWKDGGMLGKVKGKGENKGKRSYGGKKREGKLGETKIGQGVDMTIFETTAYRKQNGLPIISGSFGTKKPGNEFDKKSSLMRAQRLIVKSY
jgi:hypothetical protein